DGRPDILLLNGADWPERRTDRKPARIALYRNDGNDHFTDVTKDSGLDIEMHAMGVAVGDYDNDGRDDLYITCVLGPSHLFHNESRVESRESRAPAKASRLHRLSASRSRTLDSRLFRDVTREAGVDNAGRWGSSAAWVDYDRDGKLDLVVGNYC